MVRGTNASGANRAKILMNLRSLTLFLAAAAIVAAGGGLLTRIKSLQKLGEPGVRLDLPAFAVPFQSRLLEAAPEEKAGLPKDTSFARRLYWTVEDGQTNYVQVSIVLMGSDRTSIHKPQFCLVGQGWKIAKTEHTQISLKRPQPYELSAMKLTASREIDLGQGKSVPLHAIYVYWFVAKDSLTADHWQRMWWMAKNLLLTGTLQRWAYVSFYTTCLPGREAEAYRRIENLLSQIVPDFQLASGAADHN
jgi:hypothetical protein